MNREFTRCSDDGEPSGTAGRPMLDVILGEDIYNVAVVVTRYFGGVLLGTGGLVRAYSKAVQEGLAASKVILKQRESHLRLRQIIQDSARYSTLQEKNIPVLDSEYTDKVVMKLLVSSAGCRKRTEGNYRRNEWKSRNRKDQELYYAVIDGKL